MARPPAPDTDRRRRRGVLRHYDRPVWKDRLFWLVAVPSVVATLTFTALLVVLWGVPDSVWGWARPVLIGLVLLNLSFRLLGASVTARRHFQRGLGEGSLRRRGDLEDKGRVAGAAVGRTLRSTRGRRRPPDPTTRPASEASTRATASAPGATPRPHPRDEPSGSEPVAELVHPAGGEPRSPSDREGPHEPGGGPPEGVPPPDTTPTPPRPPVTAQRAARVAGAMVGRRLADRRRRNT